MSPANLGAKAPQEPSGDEDSVVLGGLGCLFLGCEGHGLAELRQVLLWVLLYVVKQYLHSLHIREEELQPQTEHLFSDDFEIGLMICTGDHSADERSKRIDSEALRFGVVDGLHRHHSSARLLERKDLNDLRV